MGNRISGQVVAFVHAKGRSVRVPGKNLADLGGQPLVAWAVRAAVATEKVDVVVIDSDDDVILDVGQQYGAVPIKRPARLATNGATGDDLACWQATQVDAQYLVQVVPTCPFIRPTTIERAVTTLFSTPVDTVVGMRQEQLYVWKNGRPTYATAEHPLPNSDAIPYVEWETTGLYAMRTNRLAEWPHRVYRCTTAPCYVSPVEAIDINTPEDLELARLVAAGLNARSAHVRAT